MILLFSCTIALRRSGRNCPGPSLLQIRYQVNRHLMNPQNGLDKTYKKNDNTPRKGNGVLEKNLFSSAPLPFLIRDTGGTVRRQEGRLWKK